MLKSYSKSAVRLFRKHIIRLITVAAIVAVSIGFMSGIGELEDRIKKAFNGYYAEQNISDIYLKSSSALGFSDEDVSYIRDKFGDENVKLSFCYEYESDGGIVRVYSQDLSSDINKLQLIDGALPSDSREILVERETDVLASCSVDDKVLLLNPVTFREDEYTVSGVVLNPLLVQRIEETSYIDADAAISAVIYTNETIPLSNDIYITLSDRTLFKSFSKNYDREITKIKNELNEHFGENVTVLSLYENFGIYSAVSYAEKVGLISIIFVIFFFLITLLVVHSNMSRMYDEERGQIACMKTLGYSDYGILLRYVVFVLAGTAIGGAVAMPIGIGLTRLLYTAFGLQYDMPPFPGISQMWYYAVTFGALLVMLLLLTVFTGEKMVRHNPVILLTPRAPKAGKKVILERIGFIWNKLSFKYKSTCRNILLFRSRFIMTVLSIIGSTVLVLAGFGLMDCTLKSGSSESILAIAVALIVFSGLLCALVIYNLTNINVSERTREIATLMVLGYTDREVTGYIFREIYLMSLIGAIIGVPAGVGFMAYVFELIDFGTLSEINWWTYIIAPAVTMLFCFISTLMLRGKIIKTDMNASLKILE